ncbi:MAG TPA: hypothetical protein VGN13_06820 [Solirubrobacteraceae bacterium]
MDAVVVLVVGVVVVWPVGFVSPPLGPLLAASSAAVSSGVLASVPPPLPLPLDAQVDVVIVLVSRLTAALCASRRPWIVAAVFAVIVAAAITVPTKRVPVPNVADEPTCQKTLHAWAPLTSWTAVLEPVVNVDAIWKMNTALGLPSALRITLPEASSNEPVAV